jgi:hypothetical protein
MVSATIAAIALFVVLSCSSVFADPTGSTVSGNTTVSAPTPAPAMMNNSRSTITTMVLNSIQQSSYWKAYVGNISGSLSLQNDLNYTIYSWDLTTTTGQVYASRYNNVTWSGMTCASTATVGGEETFHNMTNTADNITRTFNWTVHKQFLVGPSTIGQNSCNSTVTWINGTRQAPTTGIPYQEVLIQDANSYLIYLTGINDNQQGYDNQSYDFQMIVAESDRKATPTPYYFYVELR